MTLTLPVMSFYTRDEPVVLSVEELVKLERPGISCSLVQVTSTGIPIRALLFPMARVRTA